MTFIRRLMEIKETQLLAEGAKIEGIKYIMASLDQILKELKKEKYTYWKASPDMIVKELKGRKKDGKNKNRNLQR